MSCNWPRSPRFSFMPFGQWMIVPFRVTPKSEATWFVHEDGESNAIAQPVAICGTVSRPTHLSIRGRRSPTFSVTLLEFRHLVVHADEAHEISRPSKSVSS